MKKLYIEPQVKVVTVKIESLLTTTSQLTVGNDINNGSGDSRGGGFWDDDEE